MFIKNDSIVYLPFFIEFILCARHVLEVLHGVGALHYAVVHLGLQQDIITLHYAVVHLELQQDQT